MSEPAASGDVLLGPVRQKRNKLGFNKHYKLPYRWNVYGAPGPVSKHKWLHGVLLWAKEIAPEVRIYGKSYNAVLNPFGEINTDIVTGAIAGVVGTDVPEDDREDIRVSLREMVAPRSSTLCAGCSHLVS